MPMTGDRETDLFRKAFNSGTLTDDVKYIEADGRLLKITSMDKDAGSIEVKLLEPIRERKVNRWATLPPPRSKLPESGTLFSYYLNKVKVSKKAKKYEENTPEKVAEEKKSYKNYYKDDDNDDDIGGFHPTIHMSY